VTGDVDEVDDGELAARSFARVADVRTRMLAELERAALAGLDEWLPPSGGDAA
jgi:hypothetical protein